MADAGEVSRVAREFGGASIHIQGNAGRREGRAKVRPALVSPGGRRSLQSVRPGAPWRLHGDSLASARQRGGAYLLSLPSLCVLQGRGPSKGPMLSTQMGRGTVDNLQNLRERGLAGMYRPPPHHRSQAFCSISGQVLCGQCGRHATCSTR